MRGSYQNNRVAFLNEGNAINTSHGNKRASMQASPKSNSVYKFGNRSTKTPQTQSTFSNAKLGDYVDRSSHIKIRANEDIASSGVTSDVCSHDADDVNRGVMFLRA